MRTRITDVRLAWNSALRASLYDIYRSTTTNVADAVLLASVTGKLTYDDDSAQPESAYTYWVKARNAAGSSAFSAPAAGMRRQAADGELLYKGAPSERSTPRRPSPRTERSTCPSITPCFGAPDAGRKVVAVRPDGSIQWQYLTGMAMLSSRASERMEPFMRAFAGHEHFPRIPRRSSR